MQNKIILFTMILILQMSSYSHSKTLNIPQFPIEKAIELAKQYVDSNKIDTKNHFVASVKYLNMHDEYNKPEWLIEWRLISGSSAGDNGISPAGGQIFVHVYQNRSISITYGE